MPDPLHTTVGMLSVYADQPAMARTTPDAGHRPAAGAHPAQPPHGRRRPTRPTLLARLAAATEPGRGGLRCRHLPDHRAAADGLPAASTRSSSTARSRWTGWSRPTTRSRSLRSTGHADLADALRAAISQPALTGAGFRTGPTPRALTPAREPEELLGPAAQWSRYRTLNFQVAAADRHVRLDEPDRSTTRPAARRPRRRCCASPAATAAQLFGEDTSIGMWFFGTPTPNSPAHMRRSRSARSPAARRQNPARRAGRRDGRLQGGRPTRARRSSRPCSTARPRCAKVARPGAVTLVVVLTDGDDGESRFAMPQPTFMSKLAAERDPQRPVPIIAVGYGPDRRHDAPDRDGPGHRRQGDRRRPGDPPPRWPRPSGRARCIPCRPRADMRPELGRPAAPSTARA